MKQLKPIMVTRFSFQFVPQNMEKKYGTAVKMTETEVVQISLLNLEILKSRM